MSNRTASILSSLVVAVLALTLGATFCGRRAAGAGHCPTTASSAPGAADLPSCFERDCIA